MEAFNIALFKALYPGDHLPYEVFHWVAVMCNDLPVLAPFVLVGVWCWRPMHRVTFLVTLCAIALAMGASALMHLYVPHPRPFALGLGRNYLEHSASPSFPSDHATFLFTCAIGLLWGKVMRGGTLLMVFAILVGWGRVYLAAHFPFDVLGGFAVALLSVAIADTTRPVLENHVFPLLVKLYRFLGALFIRWDLIEP